MPQLLGQLGARQGLVTLLTAQNHQSKGKLLWEAGEELTKRTGWRAAARLGSVSSQGAQSRPLPRTSPLTPSPSAPEGHLYYQQGPALVKAAKISST